MAIILADMLKCKTINFMKKQTAVEWLFEQLTSTWYDTNSSQDIFKQAKEMEKKQMIDFADNVRYDAEKYYNQIYIDGTI